MLHGEVHGNEEVIPRLVMRGRLHHHLECTHEVVERILEVGIRVCLRLDEGLIVDIDIFDIFRGSVLTIVLVALLY